MRTVCVRSAAVVGINFSCISEEEIRRMLPLREKHRDKTQVLRVPRIYFHVCSADKLVRLYDA